jgi:lysophospholipase L1-like esterase
MKTKKILSIILILALSLCVMCSCGDDTVDNSSAPDSAATSAAGSNSDQTGSEATSSEDLRYRNTREKKPADFKYKNVRICCIGDSITQGTGTYSAYRYYLYRDLISSGATFTYVGSERSVDPRMPSAYQFHGGYGGAFIGPNTDGKNRSTYDMLGTYLGSGADIALVMIGANNYFHGVDVSDITTVYKNFIKRIIELSPGITVYCGSMVNQDNGNAPDVNKGYSSNGMNALLPNIVDSMSKEGYAVKYVDLCSITKLSGSNGDFDNGDGTHPNEQGQEKIGAAWCDAILDQVLEINDKGDNSAESVKHPSSITLNKTTATVYTGKKLRLSASVKPSDAKFTGCIWTSSDEKIATVDTFGLVKGVKSGTATITAKTIDGGIAATCEVTVSKDTSEPNYSTLVSDSFSSNTWDGDSAGFGGSGWYQYFPGGGAKTVTSKKSYEAGKNFMINLSYFCDQNTGISQSNTTYYSSVAYGGYELRIYNCGGMVKLFHEGAELDSFSSEYMLKTHLYGFSYANGKITVHRDYETLFTVKASSMPSSSKLTVVACEPSRVSCLNAVVIRKA